jgi:hypothetical protein
MKRFILPLLTACLLFAGMQAASAQTNTHCYTAATSANLSCLGIPDSSPAVTWNWPSASPKLNYAMIGQASNGSAWQAPATATASLSALYLACTPTFGSVSSGTAETALATCQVNLPGGMAANGSLLIYGYATRSATTNTDTFKLRIGTANNLSGTACFSVNATSAGQLMFGGRGDFVNLASVSSNECFLGQAFSTSVPTAININTANPIWIVFSGQPGTTGDTLTGVSMTVMYLPSAGGN